MNKFILNAAYGKLGGGVGGGFFYPNPLFVYPRTMGKTFLNMQAMQSIGRGLRGFTGPNVKPMEYPGTLDGNLLKQVGRHLSGAIVSTNPEVLKLLDNWTFNVLVDHPGLCDQLLTVILIDHDMDELHEELWRTKNWSNKALHERTWTRAKEQLRQAYEDYELLRRLTDPDCPYLVYKPKH